jgi:hypothetical protein
VLRKIMVLFPVILLHPPQEKMIKAKTSRKVQK